MKDAPMGIEFAEIAIGEADMVARGVAIGSAPLPYRLDYELETTAGFVTRRLRLSSRGEGWGRELDLRRASDGTWTAAASAEGNPDLPRPGGDTAGLAAALDCDLALSPVTNMMPILRHGLLHGGGPIEFTMAWVSVPALAVQADRQRYRHLRSAGDHHVIRYEAIDGSFAADISVDVDAVVVEYPGIGRRLSQTALPHRIAER